MLLKEKKKLQLLKRKKKRRRKKSLGNHVLNKNQHQKNRYSLFVSIFLRSLILKIEGSSSFRKKSKSRSFKKIFSHNPKMKKKVIL